MAEEKPRELRKSGGGKNVAADSATSPNPDRHMIPVWFFVGLLLLVYGILIFIKGIADWGRPATTALSDNPNFAAVLAHFNPTFWWGILLIILGGIFTLVHRPGKKT